MEQNQPTSVELFLINLVKEIVEFPEEVSVVRKVDEMGTLLTLHVSQSDMPRVIGKQGVTANALRTLLRIVGMKNEERVSMQMDEERRSNS
jgi:uncharacterized protein